MQRNVTARRIWLLEQALCAAQSGEGSLRGIEETLESERLLEERATEVSQMQTLLAEASEEVRSLRRQLLSASESVHPPCPRCSCSSEKDGGDAHAQRWKKETRAPTLTSEDALSTASRLRVEAMARRLVVREKQRDAAVARAAFLSKELGAARDEARQWWDATVQLRASLAMAKDDDGASENAPPPQPSPRVEQRRGGPARPTSSRVRKQ
jgi:hypothetical protein